MKPTTYVILQGKAKGKPIGEYLDARYGMRPNEEVSDRRGGSLQ